jgi:hypothetical protein
MGLYLCVFDADREVEGVEVGRYDDFAYFRDLIVRRLEGGRPGSKFPHLILHHDSDGEWSVSECVELKEELRSISQAFREMPAISPRAGWQSEVAALLGLRSQSLFECLIDVDGEPLLERLMDLCDVAIQSGSPVLFQ